jgi:glutathione transport system ATP-binding protein
VAHAASNLLEVDHLTVEFAARERTTVVVHGLSLAIARGETLAIVGESGSGKSVTALSVMRLVEHGGGRIAAGSIAFTRASGETVDLACADAATLRSIRGAEIAMIFQEPMTSLNPVLPVGDQIAESIRLHQPRMPRPRGGGIAHARAWCASRAPRGARRAIRTSSRAACASA